MDCIQLTLILQLVPEHVSGALRDLWSQSCLFPLLNITLLNMTPPCSTHIPLIWLRLYCFWHFQLWSIKLFNKMKRRIKSQASHVVQTNLDSVPSDSALLSLWLRPRTHTQVWIHTYYSQYCRSQVCLTLRVLLKWICSWADHDGMLCVCIIICNIIWKATLWPKDGTEWPALHVFLLRRWRFISESTGASRLAMLMLAAVAMNEQSLLWYFQSANSQSYLYYVTCNQNC